MSPENDQPVITPTERIGACPECGRAWSDPSYYCPACGRRRSGEPASRVGRLEAYAVAAIACAVAGLFALPLVGPILGIVFGKQAQRNIAADPSLQGSGLAQAGIIVGWVGLIVSILIAALIVAAFVPVVRTTSSVIHAVPS
jgi:hypothetical protein